MSGSGFPRIATLLPHAGPMCLLEHVLEHEPSHTRGRVEGQTRRDHAAPGGSSSEHWKSA